ncbi:MAG: HDOD domain-containing protein [Archangiaceae bacterium]|nr:HDOD domain-containing protein [Archangiaceae bacterium]
MTMAPGRSRILFVDDYPALLAALRLALRSERARWEVELAAGPEAALVLLEGQPYDVVVSDLEMPGMSGPELLEVVREKTPQTARLIMSGQLEPRAFARSAAVMHRFVPKPCPVPELKATLHQILELKGQLGGEVLRAVSGAVDLPSAPLVYLQLTRAAAEPSTSVKDLADIVERDPAISARLLALARSAFFGAGTPVDGVEGAIARLGVELTRMLALAAHALAAGSNDPGLPPRLRVSALQREALLGARLARTLATERPEAAFVAALLRKLGVLVMLRSHRAALCALDAREGDEGASPAERRLLGVTLPEVGACLLGLWGLGAEVVDAVLHQRETPQPGPLTTRGAVWAAGAVAEQHAGGRPALDREGLDALGLVPELPQWRQALAELDRQPG